MITDPYASVQQTIRFQSRISAEDHAVIKSMTISQGITIQSIVNRMTSSLVSTIKHHGLTDFSRIPEFVELFDRLFPPGQPVAGSIIESAGQDVSRRASKPRRTSPRNANVGTDTQGSTNR